MKKKILLDLQKFRNPVNGKYNYGECVYDFHPENIGIKQLVEKAMMMIACRKCEDAPCIEICPEEALERDDSGVVTRATNLCIGCQSCVAVCPFGTIMNEVFTAKASICDYCSFTDETKTLKCMETSPEGAIKFVSMDENRDENIYKVNERVLVKEVSWDELINNE